MGPSRYARLEDEQRYLVGDVPHGARDAREVEDRYLRGTRLRLRRVADPTGAVLKLGHKVRVAADTPSAVWHTSCYLDEAEFAALATLDADTLRKRRFTLDVGGVADEFLDALTGLVLVEGPRGFAHPPGGVEVTDDERFTGGALAALDPPGAAAIVSEARRRTS